MKLCNLGGFVGLLIAYPVSYFFQSDLVQHKITFSDYLSKIADVIKTEELRSPIITAFIVCPLVLALIGKVLDLKSKSTKKDETPPKTE